MNVILVIACLYLPAAIIVGHRLRRMRLACPTAEAVAAGVPAGLPSGSSANGSAAKSYQREMSTFLTDDKATVSQMVQQHLSQPIPS